MTGSGGSWDDVAGWWIGEVEDDPVYREDVGPLFDRLIDGCAGPVLDLGCGEGQWLRRIGPDLDAFGTDASASLLVHASQVAPVVRAELPELSWLRDAAVGAAFSLFVLDLLDDHERFFHEAARVVRDGGMLVVVINHPVFTAPGSGPFLDADFDAFWRWGRYFVNGADRVPAGDRTVTMHHRSTATLLTSAAGAGWDLEVMIEAPLGVAAIEREPAFAGQGGIPRFLGVRWRRAERPVTG